MSRKKPPSERREPPPASRIPENTGGQAYYEVEQIHVASWNPLPDGKGPSTQVHMSLTVRQLPVPLVLRFKGPGTLSALITSLERHRDDVWPGGDRAISGLPAVEYRATADAAKPAEALWERFEAAAVPPEAGAEERQVLHDAFFSGMLALMTVVKRIGEPDVPDEVGVDWLSKIEAELR